MREKITNKEDTLFDGDYFLTNGAVKIFKNKILM